MSNEGTFNSSHQVAGEAIWDSTRALRGTGGKGVPVHHRWRLQPQWKLCLPAVRLPGVGPTQHSLAKDEYESQVGPLVVSETGVDHRS